MVKRIGSSAYSTAVDVHNCVFDSNFAVTGAGGALLFGSVSIRLDWENECRGPRCWSLRIQFNYQWYMLLVQLLGI